MCKMFEGYRVLITGHSIGGALAAVLTMKILFCFKDRVQLDQCKDLLQCITFGAPCVAGYQVYQHIRDIFQCESVFKMFVNKEDPIPHLLCKLEGYDVSWIDEIIGSAMNDFIEGAIKTRSPQEGARLSSTDRTKIKHFEKSMKVGSMTELKAQMAKDVTMREVKRIVNEDLSKEIEKKTIPILKKFNYHVDAVISSNNCKSIGYKNIGEYYVLSLSQQCNIRDNLERKLEIIREDKDQKKKKLDSSFEDSWKDLKENQKSDIACYKFYQNNHDMEMYSNNIKNLLRDSKNVVTNDYSHSVIEWKLLDDVQFNKIELQIHKGKVDKLNLIIDGAWMIQTITFFGRKKNRSRTPSPGLNRAKKSARGDRQTSRSMFRSIDEINLSDSDLNVQVGPLVGKPDTVQMHGVQLSILKNDSTNIMQYDMPRAKWEVKTHFGFVKDSCGNAEFTSENVN